MSRKSKKKQLTSLNASNNIREERDKLRKQLFSFRKECRQNIECPG